MISPFANLLSAVEVTGVSVSVIDVAYIFLFCFATHLSGDDLLLFHYCIFDYLEICSQSLDLDYYFFSSLIFISFKISVNTIWLN